MKMSRILPMLATLALFATPNLTQAKVLDCAFKPDASTQGWISDRYILNWDEAAGTAEVIDDLIAYYHKQKPLPTKLRVVSAAQTAFSWTLVTTDAGGQQATMQYRATFFVGTNQMIVVSKPSGYINNYEARGSCTVK